MLKEKLLLICLAGKSLWSNAQRPGSRAVTTITLFVRGGEKVKNANAYLPPLLLLSTVDQVYLWAPTG